MSGEFHFDDVGRLVDFRGDRFMGYGEDAALRVWATPITDHRAFGGIELPAGGTAVWDPDGEAFGYIDISLLDVVYED
ncbi:MAG: hypothetical protein HKN46_03215 [Acidimicrobiia bacterium]|nr:hypothetical protein [Acidimicrobiia bacterium]